MTPAAMRRGLRGLTALLLLLPCLAQAAQEVLVLGVFAFRPKAAMAARYQPLARYLETELTDTRIELQILTQQEMEEALERNGLDLVLTNPSHYLEVRSRNTLTSPLATLVSMESGQPVAALGGVIFSRTENAGVASLHDLKGRTIAIPGPRFLGGFQAQALELLQAGIEREDVRYLSTGGHDEVIEAVLAGKADVGFVRTGIIEELVHHGKLDARQLKIINRQPLGSFPYVASTRLYPEWAFVALPHVDKRRVRQLAAALLTLEPGHPASTAAGIGGFSPPADYLPVETLARTLHAPPFDQRPPILLSDIWERYRTGLLAGILLFVVIGLLSLRLAVGNRRLAAAKRGIEAAHHALELERRHLTTLLTTLPDLVWLKDRNGVYLDCNKRFESFFGHPRAAIVGKTDYDFVDATLADSFRHHDQRAIEQGGPSTNEEWATFASDGHRELLETTKVPMTAADGTLIGVLGIGHNITGRKAMQAELEQLNASLEERAATILDTSAAGFYGVTRDGKITFINQAACTALGLTADRALGQPAHALFHHSYPDGRPFPIEDCPTHHALRRGERVLDLTETYWRQDGSPLDVMLWVHPVFEEEKPAGAIVSFVDITRQQEAARAKDLALAQAERLARLRSDFVANMSHEIRTPLNGILGFTEIARRHAGNPEKLLNALAKIQASGQHLLDVINDILDFSKIEAGKLDIERRAFALPRMLEDTAGLVQALASQKNLMLNLALDPGLPAHGEGDPLRLRQVVLNLLSNAIKFTDQGSVTLSASYLPDGRLAITVADTGIGMDPATIRHVFDPFMQADTSSTRRFGGTGLGLSITRRLVELMGGDIHVDSEPGRGSVFHITLPCPALPDPTAPAPSGSHPGQPLDGLSLLVAEDNPINREVLVDNLRHAGARVVAVDNGEEAWRAVASAGPAAFDLVLMDIQMPVMGGHEATQRILAMAPDLPVIGQTAHAYGEERERCFASGMVDHIAKPLDFDQLAILVRRHARKTSTA